MSSAPSTNTPPPAPEGLVLDRSVVTAALFLSVFTPREWRRLGPARLAEYTTWLVADPRTRIGEFAVLLDTHADRLPPHELARLALARRHAGRVLAVLAN